MAHKSKVVLDAADLEAPELAVADLEAPEVVVAEVAVAEVVVAEVAAVEAAVEAAEAPAKAPAKARNVKPVSPTPLYYAAEVGGKEYTCMLRRPVDRLVVRTDTGEVVRWTCSSRTDEKLATVLAGRLGLKAEQVKVVPVTARDTAGQPVEVVAEVVAA